MGKYIGKNISTNLSGNYSQKLHHAKQSAADPLKTVSKRAIQKTPEAASDLNKISDKIRKFLRDSQQNNSEKNTNEHNK